MPLRLQITHSSSSLSVGEQDLNGERLTIGRLPGNSLVLHDAEKKVSSRDLEIVYRENCYWGRSVGCASAYRNGRRIPSDQGEALREGDRLLVGGFELRILSATAPDSFLPTSPALSVVPTIELESPSDEPALDDEPREGVQAEVSELEQVVSGIVVPSHTVAIEEEARRLVDRMVAGRLDPRNLEVAACLQHPAAVLAVDLETRPTDWLRVLAANADRPILLLCTIVAMSGVVRTFRSLLPRGILLEQFLPSMLRFRTKPASDIERFVSGAAARMAMLAYRLHGDAGRSLQIASQFAQDACLRKERSRESVIDRPAPLPPKPGVVGWERLTTQSLSESIRAAESFAIRVRRSGSKDEIARWAEAFVRSLLREVVVPFVLD